MKESPVRNLLRRILDIVAESTGRPLDGEAQKRLENLLSTFVAGGARTPAAENFSQQHVTIMFADLRGFTSLTAAHPAGVVLELLNHCFLAMSEIIVRHGGTIDKFSGDSIMAVFFGQADGPGDEVRRAVRCAVEMQLGMEALNLRHQDHGLPPLYMGIGLNTGYVMAGLVGSELYSAYTVIGEEVNLTSRIEAFSLRGQVLISESTHGICGAFATTGEPMEAYVKGRPQRVKLREVLGIPGLELKVPRQEIRRSPRVRVNLPLSWQRVEKKIVMPQRAEGRILDIGYHGVLMESDRELAPFSELKLELALPLVALHASELYARVVKTLTKDGLSQSGLEFTSLSAENNTKLQLFVQMLLQGHEA
jgi:adenylate cyclase